jgi:hypothetical protein
MLPTYEYADFLRRTGSGTEPSQRAELDFPELDLHRRPLMEL